MHLGGRLKQERHRMRLTQVELAALGGVEPHALLRYEQGARQPRAKFLVALDSVGVDILYVVTGIKVPISLDDLAAEERELVSHLRTLPSRDQGAIMRVIGSLAEYELVRQKSAVLSR